MNVEQIRIGFAMRAVAAIVDAVVVAVLVFVPSLIVGAVVGPRLAGPVGGLVGGLIGLAYYSLEVFRAQSVGKLLFKYRITTADGGPASRDQLVKRYAVKQVPQVLSTLAAVTGLGLLGTLSGLAGLALLVAFLQILRKNNPVTLYDQYLGTTVYGPAKVSVTIPTAGDLRPQPVTAA